jgi:hypothetical protein
MVLFSGNVAGGVYEPPLCKCLQQGAFSENENKDTIERKHDLFGSSEDCKGSGCCISQLIGKQNVFVIYLGDVQWPVGCQGKV